MFLFKRKSKYADKKAMPVLAITVSLIAGLFVLITLNYLVKPVPVVIAKKDISSGRPIQAEDIIIKNVSARDRQKGTFINLKQLTGYYTTSPIYRGQQIISPQVVANPDQLNTALEGIKPNETVLTLNTEQVYWPKILRQGDLVSVAAVYPETNEVREEAVGRIVVGNDQTMLKNLSTLKEAQAVSVSQTELTLVMDIEAAKRVLLALKNSQLIYVMPRHPALGGGV